MLDHLVLGFQTALTPQNLVWCFVGVLLGTIIGLLPGLGSTTGVAVLLPLTYGGTITSVLISTPGEAASVVTTLDGYQMARQGRAGAALAIAAIGSFVAAVVSLLLLMALAPPLASVALDFGPVENLAIMILGLVIVVTFQGDALLRGAMMAVAGLLLSTVGIAAGSSFVVEATG